MIQNAARPAIPASESDQRHVKKSDRTGPLKRSGRYFSVNTITNGVTAVIAINIGYAEV